MPPIHPDSMAGDVSIDFTVIASDPCASAFTPISTIQGVDDTADVTGPVTHTAWSSETTRSLADDSRLLHTGPGGRRQRATSDGIFVFNGNNNSREPGDLVRVSGNAAEFQNQTQIQRDLGHCGSGAVSPIDVTLPFASADLSSASKACSYAAPDAPLPSISSSDGSGRLSSEGRLDQPTAWPRLARRPPPSRPQTISTPHHRRWTQSQNPDPIVFGRGVPLSARNTLRGGDTATGTCRRDDLCLGRQRRERQRVPGAAGWRPWRIHQLRARQSPPRRKPSRQRGPYASSA